MLLYQCPMLLHLMSINCFSESGPIKDTFISGALENCVSQTFVFYRLTEKPWKNEGNRLFLMNLLKIKMKAV